MSPPRLPKSGNVPIYPLLFATLVDFLVLQNFKKNSTFMDLEAEKL